MSSNKRQAEGCLSGPVHPGGHGASGSTWTLDRQCGSLHSKEVYRISPSSSTGEDTILAERGLMLLDEDTDTTIDLKLEGDHARSWPSWTPP